MNTDIEKLYVDIEYVTRTVVCMLLRNTKMLVNFTEILQLHVDQLNQFVCHSLCKHIIGC